MVNYTYEIKNTENRSRKLDSKYTYKTTEQDAQLYIFEVLLKDSENKVHSIRRIKKTQQGELISQEDTIPYNLMKKVKVNIINVNNPQETIKLRGDINHDITYTTLMEKDFYLEMTEKNNYLYCIYQIRK
jgi:hypothetical protein